MLFFFYGTLMDPAVLAAVIGRHLPPGFWQPATIAGYRRVYRAGARYPVLVAAAGEQVEGVLVAGLGAADRRRLDAFEGRDYRAKTVAVRSVRDGRVLALVYMPRPTVPASAEPWTPEAWRRRHRRAYLARVVGTRGTRGTRRPC